MGRKHPALSALLHPLHSIIGSTPEVLLQLLAALYTRDPVAAERIADRFSFVIRGIEEGAIKDWDMVISLRETIIETFNHNPPKGLTFGQRGIAWGFWPDYSGQ